MSEVFKISSLLTLVVSLFTGTLMLVEGWPVLDALYMAIITITTVGYEEVYPLSDAGRIVVIIYLIIGLGVFLYGLTAIGEIVVNTGITNALEKRKMQKSIDSAQDHVIVAGLGKMGLALVTDLLDQGETVVVIDHEAEKLTHIHQTGALWLCGDVTDDDILQQAGITRARALATVLNADADNLYVVISARLLNNDLEIFAKANTDKSIRKMEKAGANEVISPQLAGAAKMAGMIQGAHAATS